MPEEDWYEEVFDNDQDDSWFALMDNATPREGIANIVLPGAPNSENIIICHSGWGDGFYPIIGSYDADDQLLSVHIDLMVVADDRYDD